MILDIIQRLSKLFRNPHHAYKRMVEIVPANSSALQEWYDSTNVFFIVSTGRTGTFWLSNLLNNCDKAYVVHEPVPLETYSHVEAIDNNNAAYNYIEKFRKKEIYMRVAKYGESIKWYGEVNGVLRRHIEPLVSFVPAVTLFHLVRNGMDVVSSIINRGTYNGFHPVYKDFKPPIVDHYSFEWENLTEFTKVCWLWQWENKYMREHIENRIRFEDMLTSYELFCEQILDPLDLRLNKSIWNDKIQKPLNITKNKQVNGWNGWTTEQKEQFIEICGQEMNEYKYKIPETTDKWI